MPRKPKAPLAELPAIPAELLEQFGNGPMTAEAINAATMALKKALIERALGGEMNHHLGYLPGAAKPASARLSASIIWLSVNLDFFICRTPS
ncbi:transposase [Pandoraea communis]|uniref:Transposase n=1 Tax=Pandoraea communis TaxID=2508297 RepID=A0A5E4XI03_9BURK|nr:transposase [Pandoraea communis]